jgi:hypothetical protein
VELVNLAQDTEEWWILVNKEINLGDPWKANTFFDIFALYLFMVNYRRCQESRLHNVECYD